MLTEWPMTRGIGNKLIDDRRTTFFFYIPGWDEKGNPHPRPRGGHLDLYAKMLNSDSNVGSLDPE